MIIVEGPDGSGKSTVIQKLGYQGRKFKALRSGVGAEDHGNWGGSDPAPIAYARQVIQALQEEMYNPPGSDAFGTRIAFDRFHLSEMVYGPILRETSGISWEEILILERLLKARGIPVVLCLPPGPETIKTVTREGRERPKYQTLSFLREAWIEWDKIAFDRTGTPGPHHDVFFDYLADPEGPKLPRLPTAPPSVIGSPSARILIVGERSDLMIDGSPQLDLPFFSMRGCAGILNRSLWYAGFSEEEIAFTNAFTSEGRPRDLHACLLASTTHVLTLGLEAAKAVSDQGLASEFPILHAQHPARVEREQGFAYQLFKLREAVAA